MVKSSLSGLVSRVLGLGLAALLIAPGASSIGVQKVVAVQSFENKAAGSQWTTGRYTDLGTAMADQLTEALVKSGQFVVLERIGLFGVVAEQDLARSDRFQASDAAQTGRLTSAQILVKGVITELERSASEGGGSFQLGGIRVRNKAQEVQLGLIVQLVDTTTGQVIDSQRVEGSAEKGSLEASIRVEGIDAGATTNSSSATPIGKAVQLAIDRAVEYIAGRLRDVPYKGRIVKVEGDVLYIGGGGTNGISLQDEFSIYSVGEELIDPESGLLLGHDEELIGRAVVISVHEKYSKATISDPRISDRRSVKPGDLAIWTEGGSRE